MVGLCSSTSLTDQRVSVSVQQSLMSVSIFFQHQHHCLPVASQWPLSGPPVVSQWPPSGLSVASQWPPSGLSVAPQWSPSGLSVASQWPLSGGRGEGCVSAEEGGVRCVGAEEGVVRGVWVQRREG